MMSFQSITKKGVDRVCKWQHPFSIRVFNFYSKPDEPKKYHRGYYLFCYLIP